MAQALERSALEIVQGLAISLLSRVSEDQFETAMIVAMREAGYCPRCLGRNAQEERFGFVGEVFSAAEPGGGLWAWDIDKANAIVADGRDWRTLAPSTMDSVLVEAEIEEIHLTHVDVRKPGIAAFHPNKPGEVYLIDGTHRCFLYRAFGRAMPVYLLTAAEEQSCRIQGPPADTNDFQRWVQTRIEAIKK